MTRARSLKAMRRSIAPTEQQEAFALAAWLDLRRVFYIHIPNEAKRSPRTGWLLKRAGMKPGAPDYLIFDMPRMPTGYMYKGVAIELKRTVKSTTSDVQAAFLATLSERGWLTYVCKGAKEAIARLKELGF